MAEVTGSNPVAPTTPRGASLLTWRGTSWFWFELFRRACKAIEARFVFRDGVVESLSVLEKPDDACSHRSKHRF